MRYITYIIVFLFVVSISSCKKDYICTCSNANGTYDAGDVTSTKNAAKKYCESLSSNDTKCAVK